MEVKDYLVGKITCVLKKGDIVKTSEENGIKPMVDWLERGEDFSGFEAADRIVGKAAAMLFVKAKVASVYADVMSVYGRDCLQEAGIAFSYKTLTDMIINRKGDGMCPMEKTVLEVTDADTAFGILKTALKLNISHC